MQTTTAHHQRSDLVLFVLHRAGTAQQTQTTAADVNNAEFKIRIIEMKRFVPTHRRNLHGGTFFADLSTD